MSQRILMGKFVQYLKHHGGAEATRLAKILEPEDKGVCFGFALCRAAMRKSGKLEWWKDALDKITKWDGRPSSLQTQHILAQSEPTLTHDEDIKLKNSISLETLFNRVINYVLFNYADTSVYTHLPKINQTSFIRKDGDFELLHNGKVLIPKKNFVVTGHSALVIDDLKNSATKKAIAGNICLLGNSGLNLHECELSYDTETKTWAFYDPNYDNDQDRIFKDSDAGIKELFREIERVLGKDVTLEFFTLKEKNPSAIIGEKKESSISTKPLSPPLIKSQSSPSDQEVKNTKISIPPSFRKYKRNLQSNPH